MIVEQPVGGVGRPVHDAHGDAGRTSVEIPAQGGDEGLRFILDVVVDGIGGGVGWLANETGFYAPTICSRA